MKMMPCVLLGLGLLLTAAPACKKEVALSPAPISPGVPDPAEAAPADDEASDEAALQGAKEQVIREQDEALQTLGEVKWQEDVDAGAAQKASNDEEEAARLAREKKAAQDLADTENAVNAALQGVIPKLRACWGPDAAGSTTLTIRVHRLGYVLGSNLQGSSTTTSACVENVLSKVRVSGVKTDTITVKRTFQFKK